jgi:hypothetical protein
MERGAWTTDRDHTDSRPKTESIARTKDQGTRTRQAVATTDRIGRMPSQRIALREASSGHRGRDRRAGRDGEANRARMPEGNASGIPGCGTSRGQPGREVTGHNHGTDSGTKARAQDARPRPNDHRPEHRMPGAFLRAIPLPSACENPPRRTELRGSRRIEPASPLRNPVQAPGGDAAWDRIAALQQTP